MSGSRIGVLVRFLLLLVFLLAVIDSGGFVDELRLAYCRWLAASCAYVLGLAGFAISTASDSVSYAGRVFTVIPDCDGADLVCVFIAAAASLPVRAGHAYRVVAITTLMAIAAIVCLNWVRLWLLAAVALFMPEHFDTLHRPVLQGLVVLGTVATVLAWAEWVSGSGAALGPAR
jgi:exosortase/archaeosortase family protein